jgi:integrase/recombinase XerD
MDAPLEIALAWDGLAFGPESPWGCCLLSFLQGAYERSGSPHTRTLYSSTLTRFLRCPAKLPDAYTQGEVETFVRHAWHGRPPTAGTINSRLSVLSSFYRYAGRYAQDDGTPLLTRLPPTAALHRLRPDHHHHVLSYPHFEQLFAAIPTDTVIGLRDRALFLLYFWTARRRAEVLALTWGDIEHGTIIEQDGTRRAGYLYHFHGKGHSRQQDTAELPQPAYDALVAYLKAAGRYGGMHAHSPLFVAYQRRGERPLAPSTATLALKRYAAAAGLDPRSVSIHAFRHTAARARYAAGSDVREIQQLLRHASIATTDTYLRELAGTADPGARRLEHLYGKFSQQ